MTNKEAVELLKPLFEQCKGLNGCMGYIEHYFSKDEEMALDLAIKGLENARPTGEWISASERLPKAGEYVGNVAKYYLVQNEYGDMLVARYAHSGYWEQIYQHAPVADKIVAWMPLPQPYKEEAENEQ